jgi:hypothetical protein
MQSPGHAVLGHAVLGRTNLRVEQQVVPGLEANSGDFRTLSHPYSALVICADEFFAGVTGLQRGRWYIRRVAGEPK